jgi:hypothetical protein
VTVDGMAREESRDQKSVDRAGSEKTSRSRIVVGVTFEGTRFVYDVIILLHSSGERRLEIRWIEREGVIVGREIV